MNTAFSSYDEPLGPRSDRYFGDGYQKVRQELSRLRIGNSSAAGTRHEGTARLTYPTEWSRKQHRELVPHVSSVDTIMLAISLCEAAVTATRALTPEQSARMWVRHASVRAGSRPHEDLERIPVTATVTAATEDEGNDSETTFAFKVGNLAGNLTIAHPAGAASVSADGVTEYEDLGAIYGPAPHYYSNGVKDHTLTATDLRVDLACGRITGRQHVHTGGGGGYVGAESAYWDSVSPVDAVVGAAQLSQILLYQLDELDRTRSNTLWMRKLEFVADGPIRPSAGDFDGTVEIRRAPLIDRGGKRWRSADMLIKEFRGVTGSCLLAHEIPD
ncbi:AvrD family protein [Nocardia bovistercoris]|uniref:Avirulence D protein (AvrD) n=1 Tax=Nocardia bovistercoris TaxID=2785916 RepID=A0A931ID19_9NOCA|nr:AvrD family protein [Nocardia bovistercoris]MBH0777902.1 hypothetical protein [Nocardia bovistercoris]